MLTLQVYCWLEFQGAVTVSWCSISRTPQSALHGHPMCTRAGVGQSAVPTRRPREVQSSEAWRSRGHFLASAELPCLIFGRWQLLHPHLGSQQTRCCGSQLAQLLLCHQPHISHPEFIWVRWSPVRWLTQNVDAHVLGHHVDFRDVSANLGHSRPRESPEERRGFGWQSLLMP